jgi:hypothetical protein
MPWTAGSILKNYRDSLAKVPAEPVSLILGRWIQFGRIGLDRESAGGGGRPEQSHDDEFRGGAMAGLGYLVLQGTSSRKKNTSG